MALRAGYKGIKKIGTGLNLSTDGILSSIGSGGAGELSELTDVNITDAAEGDLLIYDAASEKWNNEQPDFSKVIIADSGTASANATSQQQLTIDEVSTDISGSKYMEQTINAQANTDITFTFTNAALTYASVLDIFAGCKTADYDIPTLKSKTLSVSGGTGTLSLVYNVPTAYALTVRVYIRG